MGEPTPVGGNEKPTVVSVGLRTGPVESVDLRAGHRGIGFNFQADISFLKESPFALNTKIFSGHGVGFGLTLTEGPKGTNTGVDVTYRYALAQRSLEFYVGPYYEKSGEVASALGALLGAVYHLPVIEYNCRKVDCSANVVGPLALYVDPFRLRLGAQLPPDGRASFNALWEPTAGLAAFF